MNNDIRIVVLLTATIDTKGVSHTVVDDPAYRLNEYCQALRKWLATDAVSDIIFCENSGFDLAAVKKVVSDSGKKDKLEVLQFDGQGFDRKLGKSYGEMLTMKYIANNSKKFSGADMILKVNGRYFIKNIPKLMSSLKLMNDAFVVANFHGNLTSSDSRVFAFKPEFFKEYLAKFHSQLNDSGCGSGGLAFEWALARAIHRAMGEGRRWEMLPVAPVIEGRSGSTGKKYSTSIFFTFQKDAFRLLMKYLLKW